MDMKRALRPTVRSEVALTGAGLAVNAVLAFVITWLVARAYGAEAAGQFFVVTAIFLISAAFLGMGGDTGLVRLLSRSRALDELGRVPAYLVAAVAPVGIIGALLALLILLDVERVHSWSGLGPEFQPVLVGMAVLLVPHSLLAVLLGGCRGLGDPLSYTVLQNVFVPVARLGWITTAVLVGAPVHVAVWGWLVPPSLAAVLAGIRLRRVLGRARITAAVGVETQTPAPSILRREFWRFSLPRGAGIVLERCIDWVDVLIVVALLGPAAGGVYGVVSRVVMSGALVETALSVVMGPRISASLAMTDRQGFESYFGLANRLLILVAWPIFLVLGIFAPHVLSLFGPEYLVGVAALRILCLGLLVVTAAGMLQAVLLMSGRSGWQVRNRLIQLGVLVLGCFALVPAWGVTGAATAWTAGVTVNAAITSAQIRRLHATGPDAWAAARTALMPLTYFAGVGLVLTPVLERSILVGIACGVVISLGYPLVAARLARGGKGPRNDAVGAGGEPQGPHDHHELHKDACYAHDARPRDTRTLSADQEGVNR